MEPRYSLPFKFDFLEEIHLRPNPIAPRSVHCLISYGIFLRCLQGGEGNKAVNLPVTEVAVVLVHKG